MSDKDPPTRPAAERSPTTARVDTVVAAILFVIGVVVVVEARRLGAELDQRRPGRGLLPLLHRPDHLHFGARHHLPGARSARRATTETFVDREQIGRVLSVLLPAVVYVLGIWFLGIYVASAIYIALFMIILGKYPAVKSVRAGGGHQRRVLHDVRGLVQGAAVQGHARAAALPRLLNADVTPFGASANGRTQCTDAGLRRGPDADEHRPDVRRHHPRRADRRAARPGRRQRRGDPAAADFLDVADLGHRDAVVHLLGRPVRRRDHLDPVQHPGRALVGGHHLRRLPDGAEGQGRRRR